MTSKRIRGEQGCPEAIVPKNMRHLSVDRYFVRDPGIIKMHFEVTMINWWNLWLWRETYMVPKRITAKASC